MLAERDGWRVTLTGSAVEAHLVKARKAHRCSTAAHYLTYGTVPNCGQEIAIGDLYVAVRTGAWPASDDPMRIQCARAAGWVEGAELLTRKD